MSKLTDALGITDGTQARRREAIESFRQAENDPAIAKLAAELDAVCGEIAAERLVVLRAEECRLEGELWVAKVAAEQRRQKAIDTLVRTCPAQVAETLQLIESGLKAWHSEPTPNQKDRLAAWQARGAALSECRLKLNQILRSPTALADLRELVDSYRGTLQELKYVTVDPSGEDDGKA